MTDDARCVFPGTDGVYDKEQVVAGMADHPPYVKYLIEDPHVIDAGPTAAVLTARAVVQTRRRRRASIAHHEQTFVLTDGAWSSPSSSGLRSRASEPGDAHGR